MGPSYESKWAKVISNWDKDFLVVFSENNHFEISFWYLLNLKNDIDLENLADIGDLTILNPVMENFRSENATAEFWDSKSNRHVQVEI